ncbi:VanZ family protein [Intestinibacter sp.]
MRLFQVINLAREYLILGIIGLIFIGIIYLIFFRRFSKNNGKSNVQKIIVFCILFCYVVIVIGATIFIRPGVYEHANLHLFSSYIEAWNNYSKSYWRNIILNILMFVPFGFLLPILDDKFKNFFSSMGLSLLFTVGIEMTQYATKRGIFEVDDIMNNWIGALIGYSIVMFILLIISREKTRFKPLKLILCILPTALAVGIVYKIMDNYNSQRFGNLSSNYNYVYDMSNVILNSDVELAGDDNNEKTVYISEKLSAKDAFEFAQRFFEKLGSKVDKSNIDVYDNLIMYSSTDDRYKLTVYLKGGTYDFTDFKCNKNAINQGMDKNSVKEVLEGYNIDVYEMTEFEEQKNDESSDSTYRFSVDLDEKDNKLIDGYLNVHQFENILSIDNYIYKYDAYDKFKIISQEEAYDKIKAGEFNSYELYDIQSIDIKSLKLCYKMDSKGFYQPVYRFECTIDGEGRAIFIPALEEAN